MSRLAAILLVATLATVLAVALAAYAGPFHRDRERVVGYGQIKFKGAGPERWAARYRRARAQAVALRLELRRERRVLLADPHVVEAINLACVTYGSCSTLWRRARCETGGTFSPRSLNDTSGAAGLFQFIAATWATTPYKVFSVWSPYASALAAGWMIEQGRGGEWDCQ